MSLCFGSICSVNVQLRVASEIPARLLHPPSANYGANDDQIFICFGLHLEDDRCTMTSMDGEPVGVLNTSLFTTLRQLHQSYEAQFEAYLPYNQWDEALIQSRQKSEEKSILRVHVNVYGSPLIASALGECLLKAKTYLQPPSFDRNGREYKNPQYLELPGVSHIRLNMEENLSLSHHESEVNATATEDYSLSWVDRLFDDVARDGAQDDASIWTDYRMKTALLRHQMIAHNFIRLRESHRALPESSSLWEAIRDDPDSEEISHFRHRITGASSKSARETQGGIIADDMGLGKSLVILSVVLRSLAEATEFASNYIRNSPELIAPYPSKTTLIVVPSALLIDNWIEEIRKHFYEDTLKVHKYHGNDRRISLIQLLENDIVFTTFATIVAESRKTTHLLQAVRWYRLVLDEAHVIRNSSTKQFNSINALITEKRWCLTGTPVQNSLADLSALLQFIRIPILEERPAFRKYILTPVLERKPNPYAKLRLLLKSICLRRTKTVLNLPLPIEVTHELSFSEDEMGRYNQFLSDWRHAVDRAVSKENASQVQHLVLDALLRLRLFSNHGFIESADGSFLDGLPADPDQALTYLQSIGKAICAMRDCACDVNCIGTVDNPDLGALTVCEHLLCSDCCESYRKKISKSNTCPLCGRKIKGDIFVTWPTEETQINQEREYSTKLRAVTHDLETNNETKTSVVFSFWKKTLDRVAEMLDMKNIRYRRIDGSIPIRQRRIILSEFQKLNDERILLMTLGTGAVGLNSLAVANRVHIVEPQWNPAVESQAIARLLRLGQQSNITIIRYVMKNSIEESIQSRQIRKLMDANGGFGSSSKDDAPAQRVEKIMLLEVKGDSCKKSWYKSALLLGGLLFWVARI